MSNEVIMRIAKRIFLVFIFLFVLSFLFRGWLYRQIVTYSVIDERSSYEASSPELIKFLSDNTNTVSIDPGTIVERSLSITSDKLKFKAGNNDVDPNKAVEIRYAHCVGYAAFFTTVCNKMFELNDLSGEWIAISQKGQLYFMGVNIHPYFKSVFFRDHDFVIIKNKESGELMAVDPSLHDYTGIRYITLRK